MSTQKPAFLYIDGTNLFAGQNEIFGFHRYLSFQLLIEEIKKLFPINHIYFYASYLSLINKRKFELKRLKTVEALFYKEVKQFPDLTFYKGYRSPTSGKEKGLMFIWLLTLLKMFF